MQHSLLCAAEIFKVNQVYYAKLILLNSVKDFYNYVDSHNYLKDDDYTYTSLDCGSSCTLIPGKYTRSNAQQYLHEWVCSSNNILDIEFSMLERNLEITVRVKITH